MKTKLQVLIFLFVLSFKIEIANCQWLELPSPFGIALESNMIVNNGSVYTTVINNGKSFFMGTDDLNHWKLLSSFDVNYEDYSSNILEEGVFYSYKKWASSFDVNYSTDKGLSWKKILFNGSSDVPGLFLPVDNVLLACTKTGVFKSSNTGNTWASVKNTGSENIIGISKLNSGKILLATNAQIYVSDDKGDTWNNYSAPYPNNTVQDFFEIFSNTEGTFISLILPNGYSIIYWTKDEGVNWSTVNSPSSAQYYQVKKIICNNKEWWALEDGLYRSTDQGLNWEARNAERWEDIALTNDTLYLSGGDGFFKSYDKATTWKSGNLGWNQVISDLPYPNNVFESPLTFDYYDGSLYLSNYGGVYSTVNDGQEWTIYDTWNLDCNFYSFIGNDNYIGFYGNEGFASTDKAKSWSQINTDFNADDPYHKFSVFAGAGKYLFAADWAKAYLQRSDDGGKTWEKLNASTNLIFTMASVGDNLYIAEDGILYVTEDFGISYKLAFSNLGSNANIEHLFSTGTELFAADKDKLYKRVQDFWVTADEGLKTPLGDLPKIQKIINKNDFVFANTNNSSNLEIYSSMDGGINWSQYPNTGIPNLDSDISTLNESSLYIAGLSYPNDSAFIGNLRIFKTELPTAIKDINYKRQGLNIAPNPSKGIYVISGDFLQLSNKWIVYDMYSREVKKGEGPNVLNLDISALSDGIYTLIIENLNGRMIQRLILNH